MIASSQRESFPVIGLRSRVTFRAFERLPRFVLSSPSLSSYLKIDRESFADSPSSAVCILKQT